MYIQQCTIFCQVFYNCYVHFSMFCILIQTTWKLYIKVKDMVILNLFELRA